MIEVYAGQPWYVARPESEEQLVGALEVLAAVTGPGSRGSLGFLLRTADAELPAYSAGVGGVLDPLVGQRLRFRGKVVDLTSEGGVREFWIGSIDSAEGSPRPDV